MSILVRLDGASKVVMMTEWCEEMKTTREGGDSAADAGLLPPDPISGNLSTQ